MDVATLKLIADILDVADAIARIAVRFRGNEGKIREMIAEGRDPTPEEWADLNAEMDANTDVIENS